VSLADAGLFFYLQKEGAMKKLFLVLAAILLFALMACSGGKDGDQNQTTQPTQVNADEIAPGGNNASPDANLVTVNFTDTSSSQSSATAEQASMAKRLWAVMKSVVNGNTYSLGATSSEWISQHTSSSSCGGDTKTRDAKNGYCGFTSVMMGAKYLSDKNGLNINYLPAGYSDTTTVSDVVNTKFPNNADYKNNCGGTHGINWDDIPVFANALGIDAQQFKADTSQAETWIKNALGANFPVVARVLYQGWKCSGRKAEGSTEEVFYDGGSSTHTQEMKTCYHVYNKTTGAYWSDAVHDKLLTVSAEEGYPIEETGHWVMVAEINDSDSSVLVYDPDPYAQSVNAGIRRYSKDTFFTVLETNVRSNGHPEMYELCPQPGCPQVSPAFLTTAVPIVLSTNTTYTAENTVPVVSTVVPNSAFEATGLPDCLQMDTEGRIVGECSTTGTYSVQVTMTNTANSSLRYATHSITVSVENSSSITEALQFVTPSSLNVATVGNAYLQIFGITGTAKTPTFSLISGNLPPGLSPNLQNGQIVGTPTQSGEYSFDIQASTSTSNVTKTFTLVVNPASVVVAPAPPVLSGINPPSITGMDGQQTVVFTGSGFSDGARVELTDMTNGGTYEKIPVSINSAGTEITISANFTSNSATWSASVIPLTGNASGTITFSVIAPVSAGPVISNVSPNAPTASTSAQTITITGNNYRTGAIVEITNLATGARTNLSPSTLTNLQIVVNCIFDAATQWSIRIINSDGTPSANTYITVNAPASTTVPAIPSLISPGTATAPGTILSNTAASLSWSGDASASYYAVAVRDVGSGVLVLNTTTKTPSYSLNLLEGKQYRWNAAACNAAGCSNYAAPLYFQTPASTVSPPTGTLSLSPTSCVIAAGSSTCSAVYATWSTTNATNPRLVDGNTGTVLSTAANQTSLQVWVAYPQTVFYLNNGTTQLATKTATTSCAAGSTWNGTSCR
jgi:hypothetical protein